MIKMFSKIIAAIMVLVFGALCMVANGAAKVYCHVLGFLFNFVGICVLLAVISSQWNNALIFGIIAGVGALTFLAVGLFMAVFESGRDYFSGVLRG